MSGGARRLCLLALALASPGGAQEFSFDAADFGAKPVEFSGYLELKGERLRLNRDGAFYQLAFFDQSQRDALDRGTLTFKPSAKLALAEGASASLRAHLDAQRDELAGSRTRRFDEAYLSYKESPGRTLDAGKIAIKWGKGYAWNPVGFIERPKDPNEPELAREGFTLLSADFIRNFGGALQTVALTPVVLPVSSQANGDFGERGHLNFAAKLYFLYRDTDLDLVYLGRGSRPPRFGFDFSRNLGASVEVHGEWARVRGLTLPVSDAAGNVSSERRDATSYLLGVRYLSERETTWIAELYRNGAGYSEAQARAFYDLVDTGLASFASTGDRSLLSRASALAQGSYGRPNAGRRYAYLRVAQKDPFDILYFSPALSLIVNLEDRSASLAPELLYTGVKNLELRGRVFILSGGAGTEFGEKQSSSRIELLARIYF